MTSRIGRLIVVLVMWSASGFAAETSDVPRQIKSYRHLLNMLKSRDAHYLDKGAGGGAELTGGFSTPTPNDALKGATLAPGANINAAAGGGGTDAPASS